MTTISCDISEWNPVVNDSYPHKWLILRCCDAAHYDLHADQNAGWAKAAVAKGKLAGWTAYVVYRPGQNAAVLTNLKRLGALAAVMIDVESWDGAIQGDHSAEINQLASSIAGMVGQGNVWSYANQGDYFEIWPTRPLWVKTMVAGYGASQPSGWQNLIGWQYTNGIENHTSMPSSTSPFGACDHNELFFDVTTVQGGGTVIAPPKPTSQEDYMPNLFVPGKLSNGQPSGHYWIVAGDLSERVFCNDWQNFQTLANTPNSGYVNAAMTYDQLQDIPDVTDRDGKVSAE